MPTLIVTVDLECCRCSAKIHKVLSSVQDRGEFAIEKIVYEEDKDRVLVSGPFDPDQLRCKLRCKAGKVIKNIEVAGPPATPKPKPDGKPQPPKPKPEPEPAPCNLVPYPYPYPCPYPQYPSTWPCSCPTPYCECYSSKPPPPPAPARQPACQCPTWPYCHCCSYPPYQVPPPPPIMPCTPLVVYEEIPPYGACTIM